MREWLIKAVEFSGERQSEIAEKLSTSYPADWATAREAATRLSKMMGPQLIKARQMVQISEVTGYPLPVSVDGSVDWRIMLRKSLSAARSLGALDSEMLSIALAEIPVSVVPSSDREFFERLDDELALLANKDEILAAASEGFSQLLSLPRKNEQTDI